ncbi:MAG: hypothetical protein DRH07_06250 [Deltaproteobacteria bacterium]|nr:MAG: hypothetical protein DRH07_06250 [Deltaproteobacteria bacterium]
MVSFWISFHLPDMLDGERFLDMAVTAGDGGRAVAVSMALGTLFIFSAITKAVMMTNGTVICNFQVLLMVKVNSIVKVRQGVYQY